VARGAEGEKNKRNESDVGVHKHLVVLYKHKVCRSDWQVPIATLDDLYEV
jgi:hypothetical protein